MTEEVYSPRLFADASAIIRIGEGLLARTLPRADWTHEAHLAATCWLVICRPDFDVEAELPAIIRAYNVSVGGVNDDQQGYHETLTQLYIAGVRAHVEDSDPAASLDRLVNALLISPRGSRDWPLQFYSKPQLFSVAARRTFLAPDRCAFTAGTTGWHCNPRLTPHALEDADHGSD